MAERNPMAWVEAGLPWDTTLRAVMQHLVIERLQESVPDADLKLLRGEIQRLQNSRRKAGLTPGQK